MKELSYHVMIPLEHMTPNTLRRINMNLADRETHLWREVVKGRGHYDSSVLKSLAEEIIEINRVKIKIRFSLEMRM